MDLVADSIPYLITFCLNIAKPLLVREGVYAPSEGALSELAEGSDLCQPVTIIIKTPILLVIFQSLTIISVIISHHANILCALTLVMFLSSCCSLQARQKQGLFCLSRGISV